MSDGERCVVEPRGRQRYDRDVSARRVSPGLRLSLLGTALILAGLGPTGCGSSAGNGMVGRDGGAGGVAATGGAGGSATGGAMDATGGASGGTGGAGGRGRIERGRGSAWFENLHESPPRVAAEPVERARWDHARRLLRGHGHVERRKLPGVTDHVRLRLQQLVRHREDGRYNPRWGCEDVPQRAQGLQRRARDQFVQRHFQHLRARRASRRDLRIRLRHLAERYCRHRLNGSDDLDRQLQPGAVRVDPGDRDLRRRKLQGLQERQLHRVRRNGQRHLGHGEPARAFQSHHRERLDSITLHAGRDRLRRRAVFDERHGRDLHRQRLLADRQLTARCPPRGSACRPSWHPSDPGRRHRPPTLPGALCTRDISDEPGKRGAQFLNLTYVCARKAREHSSSPHAVQEVDVLVAILSLVGSAAIVNFFQPDSEAPCRRYTFVRTATVGGWWSVSSYDPGVRSRSGAWPTDIVVNTGPWVLYPDGQRIVAVQRSQGGTESATLVDGQRFVIDADLGPSTV